MPALRADALDDNEPLDLPLEEEFRVGTLGLAWDGDTETVVIEAHRRRARTRPTSSIDEDAEDGPDRLRVRLTGAARPGVHRAGPGASSPPAARPARSAAAARPGRATSARGHNGYRR